jgi:hypothetical protein
VDSEDAAREVRKLGGKLIKGKWYELEIPNGVAFRAIVKSERAQLDDEYNVIGLNAGHIDTTTPEAKALRRPVGDFPGKRLHLVQFVAPASREWFEAVAKTGVEQVAGELFYGDAPSLRRLQKLARESSFIQWEAPYLDDYKIQPNLRNLLQTSPPESTFLIALQLVEDDDANAGTFKLIESLSGGPPLSHYVFLKQVSVKVNLKLHSISAVAARPDLISIDRSGIPTSLGEREGQISAGNLAGNSPAQGSYLAWLFS